MALGGGAVTAGGTATAAPATNLWYVSNAPKLRVDVAAGCPASIGSYRDVVNTFPGPPLAAAGPTAGLICRYSPFGGVQTLRPGHLVRQSLLSVHQAQELVAAVRALDLSGPRGASPPVAHCPADFGIYALIGFSYRSRADIGLWYSASGCQTLDNGRLGAGETANPSFYDRFLSTVNRLSPPVT